MIGNLIERYLHLHEEKILEHLQAMLFLASSRYNLLNESSTVELRTHAWMAFMDASSYMLRRHGEGDLSRAAFMRITNHENPVQKETDDVAHIRGELNRLLAAVAIELERIERRRVTLATYAALTFAAFAMFSALNDLIELAMKVASFAAWALKAALN